MEPEESLRTTFDDYQDDKNDTSNKQNEKTLRAGKSNIIKT